MKSVSLKLVAKGRLRCWLLVTNAEQTMRNSQRLAFKREVVTVICGCAKVHKIGVAPPPYAAAAGLHPITMHSPVAADITKRRIPLEFSLPLIIRFETQMAIKGVNIRHNRLR